MSIIFIGESPSHPGPALGGAIGRRLARLCSTTPEELDRLVDRHNLVPDVLERWDRRRARRNAMFVMWQLGSYDIVVLCGRKVGLAFGLGDDVLFLNPYKIPGIVGPTFYVMPHPSGKTRWWNDKTNFEEAKRLLTKLYQTWAMRDAA